MIRLLLAVTVAVTLAACNRPAAPPANAADAAPATFAINDAAGREVRVPTQPQRIVALSEIDLDILLALGVRPVGATNGRGSDRQPAYLGEQTRGIESVGSFAQPSIDRILMLQPDLILAGGHPEPQLLEQLQRIAPTVVSFRVGESWQDSFRRVATFIGHDDAALRVLDQYRSQAAALRERLQARAGTSVSIVRLSPLGPMAMLGDAFAGRVIADLGFTRPLAQQAPGAGHAPPLSRESLAEIDADWLFIGNFTPDPQGVAALAGEPAFTALRAARLGHVREVDAMQWTVIGGPLAALSVLADIERAMLAPAESASAAGR